MGCDERVPWALGGLRLHAATVAASVIMMVLACDASVVPSAGLVDSEDGGDVQLPLVISTFGANPDTNANGLYIENGIAAGVRSFLKVHPRRATPHSPTLHIVSMVSSGGDRFWFIERRELGVRSVLYYAQSQRTFPPEGGWIQGDFGKPPVPHTQLYHGTCDLNGTCSCFPEYVGDTCQTHCNKTCSGHGTCSSDGTCACTSPFSGPSCTSCSHHGTWTNGSCACDRDWEGTYCSEAVWFWDNLTRAQLIELCAAGGAAVLLIACCCVSSCYFNKTCCWASAKPPRPASYRVDDRGDSEGHSSSANYATFPGASPVASSASAAHTNLSGGRGGDTDSFGEAVRTDYDLHRTAPPGAAALSPQSPLLRTPPLSGRS